MWCVFQVTIAAETSASAGGRRRLAIEGLQADAAFVAVEDRVFEGVDAFVFVELAVDGVPTTSPRRATLGVSRRPDLLDAHSCAAMSATPVASANTQAPISAMPLWPTP